MEPVKLSETLIGREVERLFSETTASHGEVYENPVTGGRFVYGIEPINRRRRLRAVRCWHASGSPLTAQLTPRSFL